MARRGKRATGASRRVLACRPERQNRGWCERLEASGFRVVDCPLMTIEPLASREAQQKIKNLVIGLDGFEHIIFISQNAVKYAFDWFEEFWPQFPAATTLYAIGERTASMVRTRCQLGFTGTVPDLVEANAGMDSEGLLAHPGLQGVRDSRVLLCKGLGGKDLIETTLRERGARVDICCLYQRGLPDDAEKKFENMELNKNQDVFPLFSGESLENLNLVLRHHSYVEKKSIPLIVPGSRVAEMARKMGYVNTFSADNATEQAMLECLNRNFAGSGDLP